jgi:hypothetical protein
VCKAAARQHTLALMLLVVLGVGIETQPASEYRPCSPIGSLDMICPSTAGPDSQLDRVDSLCILYVVFGERRDWDWSFLRRLGHVVE